MKSVAFSRESKLPESVADVPNPDIFSCAMLLKSLFLLDSP
jgi:hypothetical protein